MKYFILLLFLFFFKFQAKEYQNITDEILKFEIDFDNMDNSYKRVFLILPKIGKYAVDFLKYHFKKKDKKVLKDFIEKLQKHTDKFNSNNKSLRLMSFVVLKGITDSSKNKNDITSYRECSEDSLAFDKKKYNYIMNFYIARINKKDNERLKFKLIKKEFNQHKCKNKNNLNSKECEKIRKNFSVPFPSFKYDNFSFSFGLCLPNFKKDKDLNTTLEENYGKLIFEILKLCNDLFHLNNYSDVSIIEMQNLIYNQEITKFEITDIFNFIPLYIIIIIIIIMIYGKPPKILIKSYFIKEENEEDINLTDLSINNPNFDKKKFLRFQKKFNLKSNWQELMNYKNPSSDKINNDQGLLYIKGLRGLSMIFLCFGFLFIILFNSPISIYNEYEFESFLKELFYSIFFFGIRYAPRILLSCSGYILFCKLINFLDEKNDEEVEKKINKHNKKQNSSKLKTKMEIDLEIDEEEINNNYNISEDEKENNTKYYEESLIRKRKTEEVKLYSLIQFILYQIHKYIFFILTVSFCLFSLPNKYKIEALFYTDLNGIVFLDTMWKIFQKDYIEITKKSILNIILGYTSTYSFFYHGDNPENLLYFFWLFYNEVIFFLISSTIIYCGYKYKFEIDLVFKLVIVLTLMIKIILFFLIDDFQNGALYYYTNNFGSFFVNPLYNFSYYCIGIYFGSLNYVLQKRITESDIENQEKPFLSSFLPVISFYQQNGILIKILNLFICILLILFNLLYFIYSKIFKVKYYEKNSIYSGEFEEVIFGKPNNFYLLIDTEIYVFIIHLACFLFCIGHNNAIKAFLTNSFWSIFNKIYTIFIIIINPTILYILFTSDMRIPLNSSYCLLYTLISGFLTFIISIFCYIFFELPCKRIIKLICKKENKKIKNIHE